MHNEAELKRTRADIFSSQTVTRALNNGVAQRRHTDGLKGFWCLSLIWCQQDDGRLYVSIKNNLECSVPRCSQACISHNSFKCLIVSQRIVMLSS